MSDPVLSLCEDLDRRSRESFERLDAQSTDSRQNFDTRSKASFIVMRWVELLDDATPLSLSVNSHISPVTAVEEFEEILKQFSSNEFYLWMYLIGAARRCESILLEDKILDRPAFCDIKPSLTPIRCFLDAADALTEDDDRDKVMAPHLSALTQLLLGLRSRLAQHYSNECLEYVRRQANSLYTRPNDLRRLDIAVLSVAAEVMRRGRAPRECSDYLVKQVSDHRDDATSAIIESFDHLLHDDPKRFQVAVVFDQVRSMRSELLGQELRFRNVKPGRVRWDTQDAVIEGSELDNFCNEHWFPGGRPKSNRNANRLAVIKIVDVDAWDKEDARIRGLRAAEVVVDLMNAGNRTRAIGVKRKVLIRDVETGRIVESKGGVRVHREAKPLRIHRPGKMNRSLRFASKANGERSWTMAILFYWISLENLFSSGSGATSRVQTIVPCSSKRTAIRDLVTYSRQLINVASQELEGFPGWVELFEAANVKCEGNIEIPEFRELLELFSSKYYQDLLSKNPKIPLYLEFRLSDFRANLTSSARLVAWASENQRSAEWVLGRALYLRNRTVHEALYEAPSERSLALACREVTDSAFEVVAVWLNRGEPDTFHAMKAFRSALGSVENNWGSKTCSEIVLSDVILGFALQQDDSDFSSGADSECVE